jgi:hypothetical protein
MLSFSPMPELTSTELKAVLKKLDEMCAQARELQEQIRGKMAEAARRDYPATDSRITARKRLRKN